MINFPINTDDAEEFWKSNVAIYWYGTYAFFIWATLWSSYWILGFVYKNQVEVQGYDILEWLHRFN